jgi:hypothetical protein
MSPRALVIVLLLSIASVARADPPGATVPTNVVDSVGIDDPRTSPGFATLDRGDASTRLGVELSDLSITNPGEGAITAQRVDGHAQYVSASGYGVYAQLPIYSMDEAGTGQGTVLGNLEVGGLYVPRYVTHGVGFVLRAGLMLPTSSELQTVDYATEIMSSISSRLTDLCLSLPATTGLRGSGSALWRSGHFFARVDLGVDASLGSQISGVHTGNVFVRANAGVGVQLGRFSLTAESTNLFNGSTSELLATGALSARVRIGPMDGYAALVVPLDQEVQNPYAGVGGGPIFNQAFTFGVEARLK